MSVSNGPMPANNGLVFAYDTNNTQKSWIGRPNNNTCNYDTYNWTDGNATVTRGVTPPIAPPVTGYEISKIQSNNGGDTSMNILYTSTVDQTNGGVYTHSAWILLTAGTYCRVGQHWNPWDAGTAWYIPLNVWTRVSYTLTNSAANYGNIANAYGTDGTIYVTAVQYERGSTMTPFMGGAGTSRSTTQAIKDLTGNNTITAPSLTYNSNGSFSFSGTDYMSAGTLAGSFSQFTVSVWFNSSAVENYRNPIDCNYSYNGTTGNIGPRLEQNSSGNLVWALSGNTTNNAVADSFTVISSGMSANTWYNSVITRDGSGLVSTYLNGTVVTNQASNPSGFVNVMNNVTIGRGFHLGGSERYFKGSVNAVQIYNRALSATEVAQNFNSQRSRYGV